MEGIKKRPGQSGIEINQEVRRYRFEIRLSKTEQSNLMEKAMQSGENSLAQFARNQLLYSGFIAASEYKTERKEQKAVLLELARIGNNLNQIARALNYDIEPSIEMLEELCRIESELTNLPLKINMKRGA